MECIKVALRVRPLVDSEINIGCRSCIERVPNEPQITIGRANQMFTYNYIFDETEGQGEVYDVAVKPLINNLYKGYNVTILAYGQTGSGKTFTMGSNYTGEQEIGIIPRAVYDIFKWIEDSKNECEISVSFVELYNEHLFDLLTNKPRELSMVEMRETSTGICIPGLSQLEVKSVKETLELLREGSACRVVGSTAMNAMSSRSHAIFTINIRVKKMNDTITSKFHLVDLAGSERSKKTGAKGDRFKEGVNINKGLMVLGKVVAQLGSGKNNFINYRDSKLTRLLQDSLGGNSVTLMIACISPADYNQIESLSTLRYADNAKKIKNKPIINQDPQLAEISRLKKENAELRLMMIGGPIKDEEILKEKLFDAHQKIKQLSKVLCDAVSYRTNMFEKTISIENAGCSFKQKLNEFVSVLNVGIPDDDPNWNNIKIKIVELQDEEKKLEREILSLDKENGKLDKYNDAVEGESQNEGLEKQTQEYVLSQAKITNEIKALSENLMWKEELLSKLVENSSRLDQVNSDEYVEELKKQLSELHQEKEDLLKQIKINTPHAQNTSAKSTENRKKQLQELETKVSALTKKVSEQQKIIKIKEKSDQKVMKLKQEVLEMKQFKVRLIQQLKGENEKFKIFKAQKNRELSNLKNQNLKKHNEIKKMEQLHFKQQNVLRRKLEAAVAANKRVMVALEKQKAVKYSKKNGTSAEKIKERFTQELELIESEFQAQKALDCLVQDRALLNKELTAIKTSLVDEAVPEEEKTKLKDEAKLIEHELELRSAEISDLQQKLMDIPQEEYFKLNWDVLQSMADVKFGLSYLLSITSEKIKENLTKTTMLSEIMEQQSEYKLQIEEYQMKLMGMESTLEKMENECEEKICLIMKVVSNKIEGTNAMSETFRIQAEELEKLDQFRKKITLLEEENSKLLQANKEADKKDLNETYSCVDETNLVPENNIFDPAEDPFWKVDTPSHIGLLKLKKNRRKRDSAQGKCNCVGYCAFGCDCLMSYHSCNENCSCDFVACIESPKRLKTKFRDLNFDDEAS